MSLSNHIFTQFFLNPLSRLMVFVQQNNFENRDTICNILYRILDKCFKYVSA